MQERVPAFCLKTRMPFSSVNGIDIFTHGLPSGWPRISGGLSGVTPQHVESPILFKMLNLAGKRAQSSRCSCHVCVDGKHVSADVQSPEMQTNIKRSLFIEHTKAEHSQLSRSPAPQGSSQELGAPSSPRGKHHPDIWRHPFLLVENPPITQIFQGSEGLRV